MNYLDFAQKPPILFGQITMNGKSKIGSFKPLWHGMTNSLMFIYHSPKGHKGQGGFTLRKHFIYLSKTD